MRPSTQYSFNYDKVELENSYNLAIQFFMLDFYQKILKQYISINYILVPRQNLGTRYYVLEFVKSKKLDSRVI